MAGASVVTPAVSAAVRSRLLRAPVDELAEGGRETITVIECVDAAGGSIPAYVIFKGKKVQHKWGQDGDLGDEAMIGCSPSGWTDTEHQLLWLEHQYKHTRKRWCAVTLLESPDHVSPNGETIIATMDGLAAHVTLRVVEKALELGIIITQLPAHTTAHLQPEDVGIFGPVKAAYKDELDRRGQRGQEINKPTFIKCVSWPLQYLTHCSGSTRRLARRPSSLRPSEAPSERPGSGHLIPKRQP
jgi:hypothetical protein